VNFDFMSQI